MFTFKKKTKRTPEEELKCEIQQLKFNLSSADATIYKLRHALAKERMNRKSVVAFLDKACVKRLNEDGTTTHTLTSFVADLTNLLITREDLGVDGEF